MPQFAHAAYAGAQTGAAEARAGRRQPADLGQEVSLARLPQLLLPGGQPPVTRRASLDAVLAAARARRFTRVVLQNWGLAMLAEDAAIVVSELVGNALRHGSERAGDHEPDVIELVVCRQADLVACAVADPGTQPPLLMPADPAAETGRGLHVIQALSSSWGWTRLDGQRKAVWALLRAPSAASLA